MAEDGSLCCFIVIQTAFLNDKPPPAVQKTLQTQKNAYNAVFPSPAQVAKLVDAGDSKSPAARCVGSSPTLGTKIQ